ncbi:transcriptional regulator, Crp/Fnr family [Rhodomicrobium vannielii ATCC 17100]|uniref:Transcriptional regulator, Crp/Fnr family n=2 Tax=Rhodomicrobium vannielii TaxID=1069 RepID=E3I398_RHOVT|nr:transcriptional regulator, Crp/Fnr family [Rhodomicrobium vannielii ATCC 17100]
MSNPAAERSHFNASRCEACFIRHRGICQALSMEQLERLSSIARRRVIPANHYIFRDGDEAISFAAVNTGVVKLIKTTSEGERHVIGLVYAPEFLGHTFAETHKFSAAAATDVDICTFPRQAFNRLLLEYPDMQRWLFEFTVQELDVTREWTLMLGRKSSFERVASLLLIIARRTRNAGAQPVHENCAEFELPLTRSELADYLGLTLETVSRKVSQLKQQGLIELRSTRDVVVPNIERLAEAASMDEHRESAKAAKVAAFPA